MIAYALFLNKILLLQVKNAVFITQVCGDGELEGDGVVPCDSATLQVTFHRSSKICKYAVFIILVLFKPSI